MSTEAPPPPPPLKQSVDLQLQHIEKRMNDLLLQTQELHQLFNNCLQDYNLYKLEEAETPNANTQSTIPQSIKENVEPNTPQATNAQRSITGKGSGNNSVGNEMLETALLSDAPNTAVSSEFKVEFCDPDEDSPQELCSEGDPDDTVDIGTNRKRRAPENRIPRDVDTTTTELEDNINNIGESIISHINNRKYRGKTRNIRSKYNNKSRIKEETGRKKRRAPSHPRMPSTIIHPITAYNNNHQIPTIPIIPQIPQSRITKNTPRAAPLFPKLCQEERERLLFDKYTLGIRRCERKWGIDVSNLLRCCKSSNSFSTDDERLLWLDTQSIYIKKRMMEMDKLLVEQNIHQKNISPVELCAVSVDRGIAFAGVKYGINLYELEYFLIDKFPLEWREMEENNWYLRSPKGRVLDMDELCFEVGKAATFGGVRYASKKCGKDIHTIMRYLKRYKSLVAAAQGQEGFNMLNIQHNHNGHDHNGHDHDASSVSKGVSDQDWSLTPNSATDMCF